MSLKKIHIKNLKMIEEAVIEPGKVNQIVGDNNNGKTSVIEGIQFAMTGSSDVSMIRNGAEKLSVELEFKDGLQVKRTLNQKGATTLNVSLGEMSPQRPQTYLNGFVGVGTFNPKLVLDPKKRGEYLLNSINVKVTPDQIKNFTGDFTLPDFNYEDHGLKVIERVSKYVYDSRTALNKDVKRAFNEYEIYSNKLGEFPESPKIKGTGIEIQNTIKEYKDEFNGLKNKHDTWKGKQKHIADLLFQKGNIWNELVECEKQFRFFETKFRGLQKSVENSETMIKQRESELGEEPDIVKETGSINDSIEELNQELQRRSAIQTYKEKQDIVEGYNQTAERLKQKAENLGVIYERVSKELPANIMSNAKLPVEGLSYENGKFTLDGVDVSQLSSSKALGLALAITKTMNKKSNLICIDGVELLDEKTYQDLHDEMAKDDFNYFMTKVGKPFEAEGDKVFHMNKGAVNG